MSRKVLPDVLSALLLVVYVGISAILWVVAYDQDEDKSRAALIGVAGAFTVGGAAVVGGWFNAWRTSRLQQAREGKQRKLDVYVSVLAALADYGRVCDEVMKYLGVVQDNTQDPDSPKCILRGKSW